MFKKKKKKKFKEKLINVNRVSKTVKGGRIFSFTALVVIGNCKGLVGFGYGKAKEISLAVKKAIEQAKKKLIKVILNKNTLQYEIRGYYTKSMIFMKPASPGTGIIAGGPMRAVLKLSGINDVLAKSYGSTNPINVVKATINGLENIQSPKTISKKRGKFNIK
ncbi:30S ribosomal protein S5 [Candidatus Annandia adelgestsuga]|uniref:Small ribosomal subunit protein uS5 n=1 Tax=Candidatus Annandia adelgestsuga TaxID=1302411 RepID=A0A3Q9CLA1_9ENTR|nr:30S ribosomal protein S5 [Candidatus Annandia adelgestsuga]AZP36205.1 30S ribosomal protein S5 [Candidatus Annandia adelgestsuga]